MPARLKIPQKLTALLVYGRLPLVFGGMLCAIVVMWTQNPIIYTIGVTLLFTSMTFDLVDGWFAARFQPDSTMAPLADRLMDKIVYSIIFPLVAVGVMWRHAVISPHLTRIELLHAIFVLLICITVLLRDSFAQFLRGFAIRKGQEPEASEFTRLRTAIAAPMGALLYAHAFYVPGGPSFPLYMRVSKLGTLPLRGLLIVEIIFLIINFGSIAGYCRKYGPYCLDELCFEDDRLRRKILSVFPNALTVMNAIMGFLAVFFAYQDRIREAFILLFGAAFFDKLDGMIARKLGLAEPPSDDKKTPRITTGGIMDDLADAVSFCIVPAWIFYLTVTRTTDPWIQQVPLGIIAIIYALSGITRLIYFTLDQSPIPGFFKGLPTPAAALLVVSPIVMFSQAMEFAPDWIRFWGFFCSGLMIVASVLMNLYPVHYAHMGKWMDQQPRKAIISMLILFVFVFTPFFGHVAFLYLFLYVLSPLKRLRNKP